MRRFLLRWAVNTAAVRPTLRGLGVRLTVSTLGQFLLVINVLLFWLIAETEVGFEVTGFGAALLGSIFYSLVTLVTSWRLFGSRKSAPNP